jgi:hypothetical protein
VAQPAPNIDSPPFAVTNSRVIDKIDLLVDVDNTASTADMQGYLAAAVPDLIGRLINPNCIETGTTATTGPSTNGACPAGSQIEFPTVHDMHIGLVSSSLGPRLGDACEPDAMALLPFANLSAHNDDQGHLLNRTLTYAADGSSATEGSLADAAQSFLYWYPTTAADSTVPQGTPVTDEGTLESDFATLIGGAGVFGCGLVSPLET